MLDDDTVDTLHERIKDVERRLYPKVLRAHRAGGAGPERGRSRQMAEGTTRRALLSVYDKTGVVDFARSLHELGWELRVVRRHRPGDREAGVPVTRWPTSPASPRCSTTGWSPCTRRCTAGSSPTAARPAPRRHGRARHRRLRPGRGQPLPVLRVARHRAIDIGGPAMVRAAAKNHAVGRHRHDPADYDGVLAEIRGDGTLSPDTRRRLARAAFAHDGGVRHPDRRMARRGGSEASAHRTAAPPSRRACEAPAELAHHHLAHPRPTRGAALRREPSPGGCPLPVAASRAGGTPPCSTAARRCRTSTSTTPKRRGGWPTRWAPTRPPWSSSTPTRAASPWPTTSPRPTSGPTSATRSPRSAASSPSTGRSTLAMADALAAGVHRGGGRARLRTRRVGPAAAEEEPPHPRGRPARRPRPDPAHHRRRLPGADGRRRQHRPLAVAGRHRGGPHRGAVARDLELAWQVVAKVTSNSIVLVKDRMAVGIGCGQQNRRRRRGAGAREGRRTCRRRRLRQRRLLPVRRRPRRGHRGRRRGRRRAGRLHPRRRGHRRRRRRRPRHGLHRRAPLPPLTAPRAATPRSPRPIARGVPQRRDLVGPWPGRISGRSRGGRRRGRARR